MDREELNKLKNIPLSDKDVMDLIDNRANLILYPDVHKYNHIDEILGENGACVLLYESRPSYGHWCAIFKLNKNELEFFNSYGDTTKYEGFPDALIDFIPKSFREESNQNHTYLAKLMLKSPYALTYNQYIFQKDEDKIKTCGRHVACRLNLRNLSLDEYCKKIKYWCKELKMDADDIVTLWTKNITK